MTTKMLAPALGAFLVLLTGVGTAEADGMQQPRTARAYGCISGPFAGPYIGASAGFGELRADQSSLGEPDTGDRSTSFVGGLYAGYNIQCDRWVFGVETDINLANLSADSSWPADSIFMNSKVDWFGTVRGRLGVTVRNNLLVYATAGLAYADVSHRLDNPTPPCCSPPFSQTDRSINTGWTVGGGAEILHMDRWILRGEALYVDLRDESHTYTLTSCGGPCTATTEWKDKFWVARLGLTLKLQRDEPVPLK
jgi:outer membrane immunogenic protein